MTYQLSPAGDSLISSFEQFRDKAYLDSKGVPTIGYGTTRINGAPVTMGMTCTLAQALEWKRQDVAGVVSAIEHLVTVQLKQKQVDALACFVYNVGVGGFSSSTLLKIINNRGPMTEDLWTRWNKIRNAAGQLVVLDGLTRRRKAEYALYTS